MANDLRHTFLRLTTHAAQRHFRQALFAVSVRGERADIIAGDIRLQSGGPASMLDAGGAFTDAMQ